MLTIHCAISHSTVALKGSHKTHHRGQQQLPLKQEWGKCVSCSKQASALPGWAGGWKDLCTWEFSEAAILGSENRKSRLSVKYPWFAQTELLPHWILKHWDLPWLNNSLDPVSSYSTAAFVPLLSLSGKDKLKEQWFMSLFASDALSLITLPFLPNELTLWT